MVDELEKGKGRVLALKWGVGLVHVSVAKLVLVLVKALVEELANVLVVVLVGKKDKV